jgi:hypothetical protein
LGVGAVCVVGEGRVCSNILLWKVIFFVCFDDFFSSCVSEE